MNPFFACLTLLGPIVISTNVTNANSGQLLALHAEAKIETLTATPDISFLEQQIAKRSQCDAAYSLEIKRLREIAKSQLYMANDDPAQVARGIAALLHAAEMGDTQSQYDLGSHYHYDRYVERNYREARRWLELAFRKNHGDAGALLARQHRYAYGTPKHVHKAVVLLKDSIALGSVNAMIELAEIYDRGEVGKPDPEAALDLYRRAALSGPNRQPQFHIILRIAEAYKYGRGTIQNSELALELHKYMAPLGYRWSMAELSDTYLKGLGSIDPLAAYQWALLADYLGPHNDLLRREPSRQRLFNMAPHQVITAFKFVENWQRPAEKPIPSNIVKIIKGK